MIIYIAGPITGVKDYRIKFATVAMVLEGAENTVFNPSLMPEGLPHDVYMPICCAMMDACDTAYFMRGWKLSKGAQMEFKYAASKGMKLLFEGEQIKLSKLEKSINKIKEAYLP